MTILIVEDNATNAMILKHLARKVTDEEILVESDAVRALTLCHNTLFDMLIVDQILPGMTGLQFVSKIRMMQRYDAVPIAMVTADQEPKLRANALETGVTDFLTKPVEAVAFRRLLTSYLDRRVSAIAG
ncbi:MAG: response regulator [Allorhizobium sp.]